MPTHVAADSDACPVEPHTHDVVVTRLRRDKVRVKYGDLSESILAEGERIWFERTRVRLLARKLIRRHDREHKPLTPVDELQRVAQRELDKKYGRGNKS